ncbi:hypothetical protein [Oceanobacillus neutriphilus]|uniref:Uncharacterized protein n=1 Tax=Oceanobacillus neutriphilus TaxID=531815 RepID=A0ABQ2NVJ4_9BACI|nr:hypothetical protein [Oceanobacillus neutriphilus]GGP11588.1 hypothetical protein GCM10011346_24350 [Oceanobacillus neutriphilus]
MFGFGIYDAFMIAGFLAIQYFLSTRNNAYWGAVIPVLLVFWLTWSLITGRIESVLAYALILLVGMIVLAMEWHEGREALSKRRNKELDKMRSQDIQ